MSDKKQYADRDIIELDKIGGHFTRHISAMTEEGLHNKADIAAELAWRDSLISDLCKALENLLYDWVWVGGEWVTSEQASDEAESILRKARREFE